MSVPRRIATDTIAAFTIAAVLLVPAPASAQGVGPVLVVGDSLEVGTEPYLRRELPRADLTIDAVKGRTSSAGVDVLAGAIEPRHEVVVFDLGTNDDPANPAGLAASLDAARQIAGDRCLVVATINRPPLAGASDAGLNRVIERFAASPGTQVADWRAATEAEPGALGTDGVHGTASGYALRGRLVADAIRACSASAAPPEPVASPHPPKPAKRAPPRELGPGLAVLVTPMIAIAARAEDLLAFARPAAAALERALAVPLGAGRRVLALIGDQPEGGE